MRKGKGLLSAMLLVSMLFTGCASNAKNDTEKDSNKDGKEVVLKLGFWGSSGEEKAYATAIEGIEKELPGVKVELQQFPSAADFWDNLPAQVAAGTAPDIITLTNEGHLGYIEDGLLAPLDDYINDMKIDMNNLSKSAREVWEINGKTYGLPITAAPALFAVNTDMWKEAGLGELPKTMDNVIEATKKLTKGDVTGLCLDLNPYHITQYVISYGGSWNGDINSPENIKAIDEVIKLYNDKLAIPAKEVGLGWDAEVLAKRKAVMSTGGTWYTGFMKDAAPDMKFEYIPVPKAVENAGSGTLHSYAYAVLDSSKNKEVASKAIAYMARDEFQKANAELTGGMPSSIKVMDTFYENNPEFSNLKGVIENAKPFSYPADPKFLTDLVKGIEENVYGGKQDKTGKVILDELQAKYKK